MNLYFPMISINWLLFHKIKYHNIELLPTMNTGIGFDLNLKSKSEWKQEFNAQKILIDVFNVIIPENIMPMKEGYSYCLKMYLPCV